MNIGKTDLVDLLIFDVDLIYYFVGGRLKMQLKKILLTLTIIFSIVSGQTYDPKTGEKIISKNIAVDESNDPCSQAILDSQNDINRNLWFGAGCLFGLFGVGASYVIEPNPDTYRFIGKSNDYIAAYTSCYRSEAKKIQQQKARHGCLTYAAVYFVLFAAMMGG